MSLYPRFEVPYAVFLPGTDLPNEQTNYDLQNADFNIDVHVIRLNALDSAIGDQELGDFRANVRGPEAFRIIQSAIIINLITGQGYKITNKPRYLKSFFRYKLDLKPAIKIELLIPDNAIVDEFNDPIIDELGDYLVY